MKTLRTAVSAIVALLAAVILTRLGGPVVAEKLAPNTVSGIVFSDADRDGVMGRDESGTPDIAVQLYRDEDADGVIGGRDRLVSETTTDGDGAFTFSVTEMGAFLAKVAVASLPEWHVLTGLNRCAVTFGEPGQSDTSCLFGHAEAPFVADEVLLGFKSEAELPRINEILADSGQKVERRSDAMGAGPGLYLLKTPPGKAEQLLAYLRQDELSDAVAFAERNGIMEGQYVPSDPDYADPAKSYGLRVIQTESAWDITKGIPSTIVAVVDSGISFSHPEFAGRIVPGYDFVNNDADPSDDHGHGTHVAGILAAAMDNGQGSTGVAPGVRIMPVKVLNSANAGTWANVSLGIRYAADHGARVINLSLGGYYPSDAVRDAIEYAASLGVLVVAGSGNLPDGDPFYPAAYPEVLAVSATNAQDQWWTSSDYGDWVDLSAPGDGIWSTVWTPANPGAYGLKTGTSMATAFVSGLAALAFSARPDLTAPDVQALIEQTSDDKGAPGPDPFYGWGRANAGAALGASAAWAHITPTPTPTPSATPTPTNTPTNTPPPTPTPYVQRVNAGSTAAYTDGQGQVWAADKAFATGSWGYVSGSAKSYTSAVTGTADDPLYQKLREGMTQYQFTVPNGAYQVRLRFADFAATKAGVRVMKITIEGVTVEAGLDVWKAAGQAIAFDKTYATTVSDGVLSIAFTKVSGTYQPMVSAIEVQRGNGSFPNPTPTPVWAPYLQRVDAGNAHDYTDTAGREWAADQKYEGSHAPTWGYGGASAESAVLGDPFTDSKLFETWDEGDSLQYKFDVPAATYQVTLRFAELVTTTVGARVMRITIDGNVVEAGLDVYAAVGGSAALDRVYTVGVTDGQLNIQFAEAGGALKPMVAALAVEYAGPPPTATPTPTATATATATPYSQRVNAGGTTYTDPQARVWMADKAFATGSWGYTSGSAKSSTTAVAGTDADPLYQKYREGMTSYSFTVPPGAYQVTLKFAEFAASKVSARVMKITLEGATVESGLDVFASAGGKAIALDRTYAVTVTDGVLNIAFTQVGGSYKPMVSAIEVR